MKRPRAADDFATIRARMEELRREREVAELGKADLQPDPRVRSARNEDWSQHEASPGPGRVRQSGPTRS
jgi:hypothetical protein